MPDLDHWPMYPRGTVEDLDVTVANYDQPVPAAEVELQVVPYRAPYEAGDGTHWVGLPKRISGLPVGKYDAWTRWTRGNGAKIIDHVGDRGAPSFEVY